MTILGLFPPTDERVRMNTSEAVNLRIRRKTGENVARYAFAGPAGISSRIRDLDREWDIERVLEAKAAGIIITGLALGLVAGRKWLALPAIAAAFLLQHALQGWCPPVSAYRRLGVRTASEIFEEKTALRILMGDFKPTSDPAEAIAQARTE